MTSFSRATDTGMTRLRGASRCLPTDSTTVHSRVLHGSDHRLTAPVWRRTRADWKRHATGVSWAVLSDRLTVLLIYDVRTRRRYSDQYDGLAVSPVRTLLTRSLARSLATAFCARRRAVTGVLCDTHAAYGP